MAFEDTRDGPISEHAQSARIMRVAEFSRTQSSNLLRNNEINVSMYRRGGIRDAYAVFQSSLRLIVLIFSRFSAMLSKMLSFACRCRRGSSHITGAMRDRKYRGAGEGEGRVASHWVRVVGIGSSARVRAQSRSRIVGEWPRIVIGELCARSQSAIGALARRREQRHRARCSARVPLIRARD